MASNGGGDSNTEQNETTDTSAEIQASKLNFKKWLDNDLEKNHKLTLLHLTHQDSKVYELFSTQPDKFEKFLDLALFILERSTNLNDTQSENYVLASSILASMVSLPQYAKLLDQKKGFLSKIVSILFTGSGQSYLCLPFLVNFTRSSENCEKILDLVPDVMKQVMSGARKCKSIIDDTSIELKTMNGRDLYDLWLSVALNMTVTEQGRRDLVKTPYNRRCLSNMLIESIDEPLSTVKIVFQIIRNICFDNMLHGFLLTNPEDCDALGALLYPIAGSDQFSEEENMALPPMVRYLQSTKERESDYEIKKIVLEALFQLCACRVSRIQLRKRNAYLILREYHKAETDDALLTLTEDIVNFLIRTEKEINVDDLRTLKLDQ